jgi:hypothetical protein
MNLDGITSGKASSPSDLIDLEETLRVGNADPMSTTSWAFRGQSKAFGSLAPSFRRIFTNKRSVATAEIIERDLIGAFRSHYQKLRGRTPDMPAPPQIGEGLDLRCLSVMQHYGVPTRLLDWTASFWTAIYFACAADSNDDAELWMYDRSIFSPQLSERSDLFPLLSPAPPLPMLPPPEPALLTERGVLVFELDPRITPRMREQAAHHTVSTDIFADHAELISALVPAPADPPAFRRVLIASGCKEKALKFLDEHKGLTASTIFPDVEGLGKFLRWHLDSLVTTLL